MTQGANCPISPIRSFPAQKGTYKTAAWPRPGPARATGRS